MPNTKSMRETTLTITFDMVFTADTTHTTQVEVYMGQYDLLWMLY